MRIKYELVDQPDGRVRMNLWTEDVQGYKDDGIFLIRDRTGLVESDPIYSSTCTALNLIEYPYGEPEGDRGFFRSNAASLIYPSAKLAKKSYYKLCKRVNFTTFDMNYIMNPANQKLIEETEGDVEIAITVSKKTKGPVYLRLDLNKPFILMKKHPQMGTCCEGIATPQEMKRTGTTEGADDGWRVSSAEFLVYSSMLEEVLEILITGIEELSTQ